MKKLNMIQMEHSINLEIYTKNELNPCNIKQMVDAV